MRYLKRSAQPRWSDPWPDSRSSTAFSVWWPSTCWPSSPERGRTTTFPQLSNRRDRRLNMEFQVIWFVLWGVLWAVYFMLDGFVLGTGMLHYVLGRSDGEKRALINTIGPVWDGNEVWLITAGGATFAAFPTTYALMFSYLYTALLLLLFALIIRGVSYEFRGKLDGAGWKKA